MHFAQVRLVNTNHLQWCRNLTWAGGGGVGGGGGGAHQQPTDLTLTLRQQLSPHPPASYTSNSQCQVCNKCDFVYLLAKAYLMSSPVHS